MSFSSRSFPSELRYDIISGDWVLIAKKRAKRPEAYRIEKKEKPKITKKDCPFCHLQTQKKPILLLFKGTKTKDLQRWTTAVVPNKYPALLPRKKIEKKKEGKFFLVLSGAGYCELVIPRDHKKTFAELSLWQIKEIIDCYQQRFLVLSKKPFVNYVLIFHNHRPEAGASQPHPHSQIITTPLIDVDLAKALFRAEDFWKREKKCIYCELNRFEMRAKKRIVFENKNFLALCPFASKCAFEVIISPKFHAPYFQEISEEQKWDLAQIFFVIMRKLKILLQDPPYNFYLHAAPCDNKNYDFYHWHFTILPKTAIFAGFELGVKIEISTIEPERAAFYLRRTKINETQN